MGMCVVRLHAYLWAWVWVSVLMYPLVLINVHVCARMPQVSRGLDRDVCARVPLGTREQVRAPVHICHGPGPGVCAHEPCINVCACVGMVSGTAVGLARGIVYVYP